MSTRGFIGAIIDGQVTGWYNHFDSYPTGQGPLFHALVNAHGNEELIARYRNITFVHDDPDDRYYENHKNALEYLASDNAEPLILQDGVSFLKLTMFCKYVWILDFDVQRLFILASPLKKGGRDTLEEDGIAAISQYRQLASITFDKLRQLSEAEWLEALQNMELGEEIEDA